MCSGECTDSCKARRKDLENEVKQLRRDLKIREDQFRMLDREVQVSVGRIKGIFVLVSDRLLSKWILHSLVACLCFYLQVCDDRANSSSMTHKVMIVSICLLFHYRFILTFDVYPLCLPRMVGHRVKRDILVIMSKTCQFDPGPTVWLHTD